MKERLQHHLSDVGESFDYLRSDVRNLSRYMAELEELIEDYRAFASNALLTTRDDRVAKHKLLKKTDKVLGPPPDKQPGAPSTDAQKAADLGNDTQMEALMPP
jgi:hypothetical protein